MQFINWFDRKFDFSSHQNIFPLIVERLIGTPLRVNHKLNKINPKYLVSNPNGKWSIQEHVGHLVDLEPLWIGRVQDILEVKKVMRPADLSNTKTHEARHNEANIDNLLSKFSELRAQLITMLNSLSRRDVFRSARHPRLNQPMRIMDLCLFVAEHDDHHLAKMTSLIKDAGLNIDY